MRIRPPSSARKAVKGVYIYTWEAAADAAAGTLNQFEILVAIIRVNLLKINLLISQIMAILYMRFNDLSYAG